jgi:arylsulfatase A-like enzyme
MLTACQGEPDKPNVLLIVLDDFGYNDLAINNGSDSPTPTLDEIARQGIRFTRHYSESSCTASRVALLTGLYPARVGAHPYLNGIDHELLTLPDVLRDQG